MIARPTKAELDKWERILSKEGLSMDRGRQCGHGYATYESDMKLPDHGLSPLEYFAGAKLQFDYTLRTASPFQGLGRSAGLLTKRGRAGADLARKRTNDQAKKDYAAGRASNLDAMFAARNKAWKDPFKKALHGRAIAMGRQFSRLAKTGQLCGQLYPTIQHVTFPYRQS